MASIAIIEDEAAIANMYKLKFDEAGYKVFLANNGKDGLEICHKENPDIVLMDLMMPEMSGQEAIKALRGTDWGKKLLVVALTNLSQSEAHLELGSSGFDDYAVKAYYTPKQLFEKVEGLLKQKAKPKQD
jgi:two-component system, OmpR family, alkaline phosphatase synthesis response regulator PhoP